MSKEVEEELTDSLARKKTVKSTDLKRRLFQIGVNHSPKNIIQSQLFPQNNSPKNNVFNKGLLALSPKQKYSQPLIFKPSHSPQLIKTSTKDFLIRKGPKSPFSSSGSQKQATTMSAFYRSDTVRGEQQQIKEALLGARQKLEQEDHCRQIQQQNQSRLDEYVRLILRGVQKIDQFIYLVRDSEENIYQLELVDFETVRKHEGQTDFQYYTVSRKGFCQYVGGKPQNFIDIAQWAQEKSLYSNIKALKFFFRFRRWKTLQMWRRTVTRQRRQTIAHSLQQKMFLLEPTTRKTLLQLRKLTNQMQKSILIIARNQGTYTLQSFKHCQERARRQASLAVQQFSRQSRGVVRKCFQNKLSQLRQNIKKNSSQQKLPSNNPMGAQSPKQGAFQALGFPSKMTYEHRSRLRKQAGRFLRFSYLVDSLHLSCLAGIYSSQVQTFVSHLQELQFNQPVRLRATIEQGKDEINSQKMFSLQLLCNFKQVPSRLINEGDQNQEFSPSKNIRLKDQQSGAKLWVFRICQHWLNMQPNLDQVLDQLTFLLRQGLISLKCFQRWAKHRQMQKYVSVLQQWDDLVSDSWQISQNDNLDPLLLLDSLDPVLSRLKLILKTTQIKITDSIRTILTSLLNAYWEYSKIDLKKLQDPDLANPAETFQHFLGHTNQLLEKVTNQLPHRIQMGVFTLLVTRIKNTLGQKFAGILQNLKISLPQLVEQRTAILNEWLTAYGSRLREEILNIDDYVRLVGVIKKADTEFSQRRDQCNELAQLYQTMQVFKMDTRKRKDFQSVTLKLKDQLDQLLIAAEQNIQRKADLYTKEVLRYHIPALLKDIAKALEVAQQPKFLKFEMSKSSVLTDLRTLQNRKQELIQQRKKCDLYMQALKLQGQNIGALDQLSKQITDRVRLWQTLEQWQNSVKEIQAETVKNLPISQIIIKVKYYRQITKELDSSLPPNEVLSYLKQKVQDYYVHLPLLQGFSESLSQSHWNQIYEILPQKFALDLKKRDFKLKEFLNSNIGLNAKQIQNIFQKSRVQAKLQNQYQQLQDDWLNLIAKIKTEGRFNIICNEESLRQDLNKLLMSFTQTLADPHAQSLKQYTITYQSLVSTQKALQQWIRVQKKIIQVQKLCRLLDIKKLADYNYFQNAERIYKQMTKSTTVKGAEMGVRLGKLIVSVTDDKIAQIDINLSKVYDNIKSILFEHRKIFPAFYLFEDSQLLKLITEPTHQLIEQATKKLLPGVKKLEIQNQRITTVITIDGDRFFKNPISTNSEIQQILFQVSQTIAQIHKRTMRTCRYKAIQNNLSSLVEIHNIQHLLAVNRVDFSQYTTISIQNQQETSESLNQFRKVMRKDTAEDIKNRQTMKQNQSESKQQNFSLVYKYDTLLLQQLVHEEILDQLIRSNIQHPQEFIWASQLKFYWEDTAADQQNITIRQLHLNLKYGNDFLGSNTKVIIQSEAQLLLGLKLSQPVIYTGKSYALQRLFNAMGYKMLNYTCSPSTSQLSLKNFLIGCYFSDYLPVLNLADKLPLSLKSAISNHNWVNQFKAGSVKKNSTFIRQIQHSYTMFATLRNTASAYSFGGSFRVVNYNPPKSEFLKGGMKLLNIFEQQKTNIFLRIFSSIRFLEQRSDMQGVSLQKFLDQSLLQQASEDQHSLFIRLLTHLKSKISIQTYQALQKHLQSLGLVPVSTLKLFTNNRLNNLIKYLWQRKIIIFGGQGRSKKHFLKTQLNKQEINIIDVFGQSLPLDDKQLKKYLLSIAKQSQRKDRIVLYIESLTPRLLLTLEKLIYFDNFFNSTEPKLAIVLDIPTIDKFVDPHSISSFLVFNYQNQKEYISLALNQWIAKNFQEQRHRQVTKILQQIVLPCLQNLNSKDEKMLEQKFIKFLKHMESLFPIKNVLEAAIYTLGILYRGYEQQELKLEYLTKKHLGDDYFGQGTHINNLIYSKHTQKEGMVTQSVFFMNWMVQTFFKDKDYIITPEIIHLLTACRRIHDQTECGIILQGKGNTGKSTCLQIYRQLYHQNSFYISISSKQTKNWSKKINLTLQKHGINLLGARINYKQTIIMIQDLNLAQKRQLVPLQLMTQYKKIKTETGIMKLKNVKYLFTSSFVTQVLDKQSLRIKIVSGFESLKGIFISQLKQSCDSQWDVQPQFLHKIVNVSYDICRKVNHETQLQMKEGFTCLKRMIAGFSKLKIKQTNNPQKEIQKFWAFALLQSLKSYNHNQNILQNELKRLQFSAYNNTLLGYTHLNSKPTDKKIQILRDPKRLYNALNERIEKYNQSDSKRYGDSFEFINFDCILQKIISISHSILLSKDHMLVGRDGSGKESLVKLAAFFNGIHYRQINGSIKTYIMQILDTSIPTPYLLLKKVNTVQDQNWLQQYCYCDFESEILGQNEGKPRIGTRQKQKNMLATKSTKNNLVTNETYTMPKAKMSWQQVTAFRQSFRLVVTMTKRDEIMKISKEVRSNFHFDLIDQVPVASILQYNQKLLAVDGLTCCKQAIQLLSQIYEYSRDQLEISLRSNDDCVRLFSSFLANLISEMTLQAQKYGKILQLLHKLRKCCTMINESLCQAHSKLKQLSLIGQSSRQPKAEIQILLRQKSTALSICQKLVQILSWLEPFYTQRYNAMQIYLQNRNKLQLTFATTASYFIYLSNIKYVKRRQIYEKWIKNIKLMNTFPPIKSFLPLFLLYEEQFQTEPIDDLPEFYQNMAIVFHSAKPIVIEDDCNRGRQWLVKNCSFTYLRQDQKDFNQILCQQLIKGGNIIIEVTNQETMNKLTETTVGILLFLPESVNTINIKGQQIQLHQQAKVYILVSKGIKIPKHLIPQFTIVRFAQNEKLAEKALTHEFLCYTQRQFQITSLELSKKMKKQINDCQMVISSIAQSINEQLCGTEPSPEQSVLIESLSKITDKLMSKAQSQFTKIKQKQVYVHDLKEKYDLTASRLVLWPAQQFYKFFNKVSQILTFMAQKTNRKYSVPSYAQLFQTIKTGLSKGTINNIPSLILFTIRQWGPLYSKQDYLIFNLLLVLAYKGVVFEQLNSILTSQGIKNGALLSLIKRQPQPILNEQIIQQEVTQALIEIFREQNFKSVASFITYKDNLFQPVLWLQYDGNFKPIQKVVRVVCQCTQSEIKQKIMILNQKIKEPTQQQSLETLLKKSSNQQIMILSYSRAAALEYQKILKNWNITQNSIIFIHDSKNFQKNSQQLYWQFNLDNPQNVFKKIINAYIDIMQISQPQSSKNCQEISQETPSISNRVSVHYSQTNQENLQLLTDKFYYFIESLVNFIKKLLQNAGLPIPLFKKPELLLVRKSIQNNDNSLTLSVKVECVIKYINSLISIEISQIQSLLKTIYTKIIKVSQKNQESQFYTQIQSILAEGKDYKQDLQSQEIKFINIELGWLTRTRKLLGFTNSQFIDRYIKHIQTYLDCYKYGKETPQVSRGSKRQINIRNKRDSVSRKGRQSMSLTKKLDKKLMNISKFQSNQLACIHLLKESQSYQRILHQINIDLQQAREQLQNFNYLPNQSVIRILLKLLQNQGVPSWKSMLAKIGCNNLPLALALRQIVSRRNQIYTYYNKFTISGTFQLDFTYLQYPAQFLKVYFTTQLTSRDVFLVSSVLTAEQAERGEYLRVGGLWGCGWKMNLQGMLQHLGDNKIIQISSCYLIKKSVTSLGFCPIQVYISPENTNSLMKVYCISKKLQTGYKLYLKSDN